MKKTGYVDESGNELIFHINADRALFIMAGDPTENYYNGYVCLDKQDVNDLIIDLKKILSEM